MGRESIRRRTGAVAVAALLLLAPASGALALVAGGSPPVTHPKSSSAADEVRSPSDTTIDALHAGGVRRSWAGSATANLRTEDDSDGVAAQDESSGGGSGGENGSGQDESGGNGQGDGAAGVTTTTTTTTTTSTTTTAPPVTSTTARPPTASSEATDEPVSEDADEGSEAGERETTPAGGATPSTTTTTPPTELRAGPPTGESSSRGSSDVSEPDPALAAALAREESWSFLAGQDLSPSTRPNRVETVDPAPNASSVVLSWLVGHNSNGASMAVFGPVVVLLTIWDAVASAGSGLAAPASALGTFVMLILFEKGQVVDVGARLLGRRPER